MAAAAKARATELEARLSVAEAERSTPITRTLPAASFVGTVSASTSATSIAVRS